jgi:hypothetical protein
LILTICHFQIYIYFPLENSWEPVGATYVDYDSGIATASLSPSIAYRAGNVWKLAIMRRTSASGNNNNTTPPPLETISTSPVPNETDESGISIPMVLGISAGSLVLVAVLVRFYVRKPKPLVILPNRLVRRGVHRSGGIHSLFSMAGPPVPSNVPYTRDNNRFQRKKI